MGMFDFLKKRKETELPLPPPPSAPDMTFQSDIEPIRAPQAEMPHETMPPVEETHDLDLPELPPALPAPRADIRPIQMPVEEEHEEPKDIIYDRTINPQEEKPVIRTEKPSFIAVDDYRRIITDTNTVRAKLMNAENFARRLSDIKNTEERAFEKWQGYLEDVEKKMNYVDQLIAKAQR
jgi:hypothetical protein